MTTPTTSTNPSTTGAPLAAGDTIPAWVLPITPTLVVSTAISTRDFQDVHHDRDIAQAAGSKDIFVNILTSTALVERYVTEWLHERTGDWDTDVRGIAIRLGAPAYPYDTLTFTGSVASVEDGVATLQVTGAVPLGDHVTGTVKVAVR
ncbi:MaoC/PaaZ C-terminal domain-containing protein [Nocardioides abyssi]|uniref:MaoC/PaaZ C-terminal domain-containing protein n=1 Tax=Nocardioides abyssi TaxID=3058370 RepID=A0ABT8EXX4_9ACTN|nr:MaoC/PaaZ C-terminal domain-containing protein [Nocardioides abyssi]MDN4162968.1 MaoC/PaaZ C-terminal domain-containing protein [Nocardioides abyssi]